VKNGTLPWMAQIPNVARATLPRRLLWTMTADRDANEHTHSNTHANRHSDAYRDTPASDRHNRCNRCSDGDGHPTLNCHANRITDTHGHKEPNLRGLCRELRCQPRRGNQRTDSWREPCAGSSTTVGVRGLRCKRRWSGQHQRIGRGRQQCLVRVRDIAANTAGHSDHHSDAAGHRNGNRHAGAYPDRHGDAVTHARGYPNPEAD